MEGAIIVWDGVSGGPEKNDGGNDRWNIKVVLPPNHPDVAILNQLANDELQRSEFKGVLPQGGIMPVATVGPAEFNGLYPGWSCVNCSTFKHPQVFDENGQIMDPMIYGAQVYSGQQVNVLVHCSAYNNKSRGVAARMDGFSIIMSAGAQPTSLGGGGVNAGGAFGQPAGGAQQAPQQQQQGGYQAPQQQQQGGYQTPQQQGGYQAPQQQAPQQPQQSTNFLPAGPAPAGPGGPAPAGPGGPAPEPKYVTADGSAWTRAQLLPVGYTDEQINALPVAQ